MATAPLWHGTAPEMQALTDAFKSNCECVVADGTVKTVCAVHQMLTGPDAQRLLDDLLFMRRMVKRLFPEDLQDAPDAV